MCKLYKIQFTNQFSNNKFCQFILFLRKKFIKFFLIGKNKIYVKIKVYLIIL